jgi:hypothetical protein
MNEDRVAHSGPQRPDPTQTRYFLIAFSSQAMPPVQAAEEMARHLGARALGQRGGAHPAGHPTDALQIGHDEITSVSRDRLRQLFRAYDVLDQSGVDTNNLLNLHS